MENDDSKSFRVRFDDDESIPPLRREEVSSNRPLTKLNQRLTFISILIPCLIAVIIIIVYISLNKKISGIQDSGSIKVQSLSKELEEKLASLSGNTDQLKELIENQSKQFEKKLSAVSGDLGKNKNSLKQSVDAKANKSDLNKHVTEISAKIEGLKKNIGTVSSDIQTLDSNLNSKIEKELKSLSDTLAAMTTDVNRLKQEIGRLSDAGIDQKKLAYELNLQEKKYTTELRQAIIELEKKISSARKAAVKSTENSLKTPLPKLETSQKPVADPLKENKIIEQDIPE
ncbi:MAG: hypothetical protein R6X10_09440 [Desulfobacterales bacterium]